MTPLTFELLCACGCGAVEGRCRVRQSHTVVTHDADRITITTTKRRSDAILMVLSGASLEDAGRVLGVSRQRVQQYLRDAGLSTRMRMRHGGGDLRARQGFLGRSKRDRERRERRRMHGSHCVELIRRFAATHGRAPTYQELAAAVFGGEMVANVAHNRLLGYLGRTQWERRRTRRLIAVYRMAGVERWHGNRKVS